MKITALFLRACAIIGFAGCLYAEELNPAESGDWVYINGGGAMTARKDGSFLISGAANYRTKDSMPVEPEKIYMLSGEFRTPEGAEAGYFFFGLMPMDAEGKSIDSPSIDVVPGTETEMTESAPAGTFTLSVKNAEKWKTGGVFIVAGNVKSDFSDLPNRDLSGRVKEVRKNADGSWTIELTSPLRMELGNGVKIREHRDGNSYMYSGAGQVKAPAGEWKKYSAIIKKEAKTGESISSWWRGTRQARICILGNTGGTKEQVLQFRNVKLEELER